MKFMLMIASFFLSIVLQFQSAHADVNSIQMLPPVDPVSGLADDCNDGLFSRFLTWDGQSTIKCSSAIKIDNGGNIIGGGSIQVKSITTTETLKIGTTTETCTSANAGAMKFDVSSKAFLGCDGTNWITLGKDAAPRNMINYDTAGTYTWTVPANVTRIEVEVWGGGGGAAGYGGSGGGGGYATGFYDVTPGSVLEITVGAGGVGTRWINATNVRGFGTDGGTSSVDTLISATGGKGSTGHSAMGGSGIGGQLNIEGGDSIDIGNNTHGHNTYGGVYGGSSPRGGQGGGVYTIGSFSAANHLSDGKQPGGGGGGNYYGGGNGADGGVVIRY